MRWSSKGTQVLQLASVCILLGFGAQQTGAQVPADVYKEGDAFAGAASADQGAPVVDPGALSTTAASLRCAAKRTDVNCTLLPSPHP
jgi:hypothetical protein